MGLSCLFGHDFADATHRQERERHGEEVVLTTRNVETCRRCGTERVLAENTAVVKHEANHAGEAGPDAENDGPASETAPTAGGGSPAASDTSGSSTDPDSVGVESADADEPPVTDDAVILTDGSREKRRPMEWPEFGTAGTAPGKSGVAEGGGRSGTREGRRDDFGVDTTRDTPELCCESCETTWDPTAASLLAGDLCPRCRSAYLTDA
jgi:hypothetical protein